MLKPHETPKKLGSERLFNMVNLSRLHSNRSYYMDTTTHG